MQKRCFAAVCAVLMVAAALGAQTGGGPAASYYVSAAGNDRNNGLSEARAFRTLAHAVSKAAASDIIKTVTVIGTLNQASEGGAGSPLDVVFHLRGAVGGSGGAVGPVLITGLPNAPARRRAVLSGAGTEGDCVWALGAFRFEHIEISGSRERGLYIDSNSEVTLGPGSLVKNHEGGGVYVTFPSDDPDTLPGPGVLILDGGIVENNRGDWWRGAGGIYVGGGFTMKGGSVRNNEAVSYGDAGSMGGGICIDSDEPVLIEGGDISGNTAIYGGGLCIYKGRVTMSGGSISGNTAEGRGGGVWICEGASFIRIGGRIGGTVSGNSAPESPDIGQED
jgi:hypothetical protein